MKIVESGGAQLGLITIGVGLQDWMAQAIGR
jgi:hypothetical protein